MSDDVKATVADNQAENRYEIRVGDQVAGFADYTSREGEVDFTHTEVSEEFSGKGLAQQLAAGALDDVRARGLQALPHCGFIAKYISKNTEYVDLVPADRRSEFGLD